MRQPKTRANSKYAERRHKIKCANCGTPTAKPAMGTVAGIVKWFCETCIKRVARSNGTANGTN